MAEHFSNLIKSINQEPGIPINLRHKKYEENQTRPIIVKLLKTGDERENPESNQRKTDMLYAEAQVYG